MDPALELTVKRLNALGLVSGYGNGDFGVDRTITRAEFATLVVRARGLEQGAKLAQFQSNFTDVKTSDWFAGFVNVASGQEIVKGFPDKSFKPQAQVTYAEAVAMIIRALGYEPSVKGVWPNNYIAKASELGIAKSINTPNNAATRGDVFKMLDNALRVDLMKQVEYGTDIRFEVRDGQTLLTEYLDVTVRDMEWANSDDNEAEDLPFVTNVPVVGLGTLDANEVTLDGRAAGLGTSTYKVADGINPNNFAGQHVQVWVKDGKEKTIVWMEGSEDEEVINGRVDTWYYDEKVQSNGDKVDSKSDIAKLELLLDNEKTYSFSENVAVSYNFKRFGTGENAAKGLSAIMDGNGTFAAKVVLNDEGEISYIHVIDDVTVDQAVAGVKYGSEVIEKVDADKKKITNLEGGSFDLKDKEEGEDFLVFINGQPAKLADLKENDVYTVYYADGNKNKPLVFVTRNVVEGKVDKVEIRNSGDNRLKIGDKTYRVRSASYSENANKDVAKITNDELRDLDGVEVTLFLAPDGRIRHIVTKDNVNDRKFKAILTKQAVYDSKDDKWNFTVYSEKDSKVNISIEAEDIKDADGNKLTDDEVEALFVPSKDQDELLLLEVTLDSKGEAEKVQILDTTGLQMLEGDAWEKAADEDGDTLNVTIDGKKKTFDVTDDTVVFDMTGEITDGKRVELKDADIAKFKSVADDEDLTVYYLVDDNEVDTIFVVEGDGIESNTQYGYVKSFGRAGDDDITVLTKVDGKFEEKTYKLDGDADDLFGDVNRFDFIKFSLNSDNEVIIDDVVKIVEGSGEDELEGFAELAIDNTDADELEEAELDRLTVARVDDVDGRKITFKTEDETYEYLTDANTVFVNDDFEILDGVQEGDYVVLVETDDDSQRFDFVLVVSDEDTVEEEELEDNALAFLAQSDEGITVEDPSDEPSDEPVDLIDEDSFTATEVEKLPGMLSQYTVTGQGEAGATVTLTVDGRSATATVAANGTFTVSVVGKVGVANFTIEASKGDDTEGPFTGTFTK
ncbi:S-layer homology domain-containing protein [Brevibacillus sp. H7]|uniref:S-layer homology domain-containing protein n=1 Tax=Brevibacillus sp. H7 TaxID=3349138 RepID=UPI0037F1A094